MAGLAHWRLQFRISSYYCGDGTQTVRLQDYHCLALLLLPEDVAMHLALLGLLETEKMDLSYQDARPVPHLVSPFSPWRMSQRHAHVQRVYSWLRVCALARMLLRCDVFQFSAGCRLVKLASI